MIRRCQVDDWRDVRRLHVKLSLGFPVVVDVTINEVLMTPDGSWRDFVRACAGDEDQALFVAVPVEGGGGSCVGMGHARRRATAVHLSMLYVVEDVRRQGLGGGLVTALEGWARAAGATELVSHIPDASAATALAQARGWHRTSEVFSTRHGLRERKWTGVMLPTAPADDRGTRGRR